MCPSSIMVKHLSHLIKVQCSYCKCRKKTSTPKTEHWMKIASKDQLLV